MTCRTGRANQQLRSHAFCPSQNDVAVVISLYRREELLKFLILLVFLSVPFSLLCAQREECPQFSGAVKARMEQEARWLVSDSLQEQVASRSSAFGRLIALERCHILQSNLLSEQVTEEQGPFFVADRVPLKSRVGRYEGTWMMVVAPAEATGRMPDANVLEITDHKWTLLRRDKAGGTPVLAAGAF